MYNCTDFLLYIDIGYSYDDSLQFDSMIMNQAFPVVDDPYSSLHAYQFKDDGN